MRDRGFDLGPWPGKEPSEQTVFDTFNVDHKGGEGYEKNKGIKMDEFTPCPGLLVSGRFRLFANGYPL